VTRETAQSTSDIVRDGRFFGNDELLGHKKGSDFPESGRLGVESSLREAQNDKCNRNVKQETAARQNQPLALARSSY
jgi:hypothetical protein